MVAAGIEPVCDAARRARHGRGVHAATVFAAPAAAVNPLSAAAATPAAAASVSAFAAPARHSSAGRERRRIGAAVADEIRMACELKEAPDVGRHGVERLQRRVGPGHNCAGGRLRDAEAHDVHGREHFV